MLDKIVKKLEKESFECGEMSDKYNAYNTLDDAVCESLTALNTFIESSGWQDIKTAPKDTTAILLFNGAEHKWDRLCVGWWSIRHRCWETEVGRYKIVTHWQPLSSIKSIKE